jgi:predicted nucleic acid-binding protein
MYLDSAYIVKFYLNEADSDRVRGALAIADELVSSVWAVAEVACAFHRNYRDGKIDEAEYRELLAAFRDHTAAGVWMLTPVTERVLFRLTAVMNALPRRGVYLRSGDAVHLITAADLGERQIWSNDAHLIAAAPYFGLQPRTA